MHDEDAQFGVWLQPGEYVVAQTGCVVRTLLGSCVSVTLWHPASRIGAMSHFLLWSRPRGRSATPDARYGEDAIPLMFEQLARRGVKAQDCQAKIFGGGNMFPEWARRSSARTVGEQNGQQARALLLQMGVPIASECLYGSGHRTVVFDVSLGDVWVRQSANGGFGATRPQGLPATLPMPMPLTA
jgi:chemotaxis protein CheD